MRGFFSPSRSKRKLTFFLHLKKKTEKALARVAEEVERDLELVGVTAIEDKLADGVPAAVASLVRGGVKVRFYFFPSPVLLGLLSFLFSFSPFGLEKKKLSQRSG